MICPYVSSMLHLLTTFSHPLICLGGGAFTDSLALGNPVGGHPVPRFIKLIVIVILILIRIACVLCPGVVAEKERRGGRAQTGQSCGRALHQEKMVIFGLSSNTIRKYCALSFSFIIFQHLSLWTSPRFS